MSRAATFAIFAALALLFFGCAAIQPQDKSNSSFFNDSSAVSLNKSAPAPVVVFTCPDGTLVTDSGACGMGGNNTTYVCPDGRIVSSISDCQTCKTTCDDSDPCTTDICSSQTNFECVHVKKTTPDCQIAESGCAGGNVVNGKCVCPSPADLEVNGVCTKSLCLIDWGGGRVENLTSGECSDSYYNGSNERPYCDFNLQVTHDCTICGCQGGVACIDGLCATQSSKDIPVGATPVYESADDYGIQLTPKLVTPDLNVSFVLADMNGVPLEVFTAMAGDTIAKRISTLGYVNFTLARANFDLDQKYQWVEFTFNRYTVPCVEVSPKKSMAIKTGVMASQAEYLIQSANSTSVLLREKQAAKTVMLSLNESEIELTSAKGVYLSLCGTSNTTAFITVSSSRPFDIRQINY